MKISHRIIIKIQLAKRTRWKRKIAHRSKKSSDRTDHAKNPTESKRMRFANIADMPTELSYTHRPCVEQARERRIVWVVSAVVVPRRGMCPIRLSDTSTRFAYFHFDIENGQGITLNAVEKFRRRRGLGSTPRWSGTIYFARDLLMIYLRCACEVSPIGMR